jgi:hypothetical protein
MFSRFYRPPWIAFLRKAWQKKIPQRSEDDFLLANQAPKGGRLAAKTRQSKTFAA